MCNIKTVQDSHVPVHWNPFSKGTTCWGECTYKGIPILPQHFPLYSSREVVPLLPYLLHLWAMTYIIMNEGIAIARGVYFLLDHTCTPPRMLHVWTLIDKKKKKKNLKYCIYIHVLLFIYLFIYYLFPFYLTRVALSVSSTALPRGPVNTDIKKNII